MRWTTVSIAEIPRSYPAARAQFDHEIMVLARRVRDKDNWCGLSTFICGLRAATGTRASGDEPSSGSAVNSANTAEGRRRPELPEVLYIDISKELHPTYLRALDAVWLMDSGVAAVLRIGDRTAVLTGLFERWLHNKPMNARLIGIADTTKVQFSPTAYGFHGAQFLLVLNGIRRTFSETSITSNYDAPPGKCLQSY